MNKLLFHCCIASLGLYLVQAQAHAAQISYTFSSTTVIEIRNGADATADQRLFTSSDSITGTFVYDNAAAGVNDTFGTLYDNITSLNVTVDGFDVTDPSGTTLVSNDRWPPASGGLVDAILIQSCRCLLPDPGSPQIADGTNEIFTLHDVRFYWGENVSGIDFLSDEFLPSSLPPSPFSLEQSVVALTFVTLNGSTIVDRHAVQARFSSMAVVPIPATIWAFGSALGLLGWIRRKS